MIRLALRLLIGLSLISSSAAYASQSINVRAIGEPQSLDWNRGSTWIEGFILRNLMEGLVSIDSHLNAVPALAERWEVTADHKTYTFYIRSGVRWADGVTLKAQDFVASWKRLLEPSTNAKYASFLFDIDGAESFHKGENKDFSRVGVKAINTLTLQVKLRAPIAYWYWVPSFYATFPIREDLLKNSDPQAAQKYTLGPYVLSSYDPGKKIVLVKNPKYYGARGNIDELVLNIIADDAKAAKMYKDGQLDFSTKIPSLERRRLKTLPEFHDWPDLRTIHLRINTRKGVTKNAAVRRAIGLAIDRSKLTSIFEGSYEPAGSFVPPGIMSYSKQAGLSFNPELAKKELKAAGIDAAALPPLNLLTVSFDDQIILAQFIQRELKENLGITVRIHILEPKRYYSPALANDDYDMQINFWGADFPDPDNFYSIFLGNSGLNRYGWDDAKYDTLVREARSMPDKKNREKAYLSAQKILLEDSVATVPLFYGRINALVRSGIYRSADGPEPGPMNWWSFKDFSKKEN